MKSNTQVALVLAAFFVLTASLPAAEFFVSPSGLDGNPGTEAKPFATLARAQAAVREARSGGAVTVNLRAGTYYLPETLVFTAADSGTKDAPVVWQAWRDERPVVSGGVRLDLQWRPFRDGILQAKVPAGLATDQLFVNGERQILARYPNFDPAIRIFGGYSKDAFSPARAARWADPHGGFIHAMHSHEWGDFHYLITGAEADHTVRYEGGWQNNRRMGMHPEHRFVENIFEELDAPGEWFHDVKTGTLYFQPPAGLDLAKAVVEAVRLRHLVEFRGDEAHPAKFVALRGLAFRHAARTFMANKEPLLRSDWTTYRGGAVFFNGAEDCGLEGCFVDQVGGNAVFVNNYNRRVMVRGCHIAQAGANGVAFIGDPKAVRSPLFEYGESQEFAKIDRTPGPQTPNYPADCLVEDCLIHETGRVEKQTAGVTIDMAQGITVRHCSIYQVPRAGINIGDGCWGGHVVEFCDIFDTVLETGDHGSFNSWGRDRYWSPNSGEVATRLAQAPELPLLDVVKPNVLRNNRWRCDHGWDIDLDDGSSNYEIYNNLCLNGGLKNREGFHRRVENNIVVNNTFHPHVWYPKSEDVFRHNIVFADYRPVRVAQPWGRECDFNLLHEAGRSGVAPAAQLQKQSGRDEHSIVADAQFADPAHGDFRVKDGSPALKLGFVNFPMDRFGVQSPALKALARTPDFSASLNTAKITRAAPSKPAAAAGAGAWLGVGVRELQGEEYSAYGVSRESGGVLLAKVPAGSAAAKAGFRDNDLIQGVNGKPVPSLAVLWAAVGAADGKPLSISHVRNQKTETATVAEYVWFSVAQAATPDALPARPGAQPKVTPAFSARPQPANEPVAVLGDGKLAANYGPVFENNVVGGCYKADLGASVAVREVRTWSYRKTPSRGGQRFVLYGSHAAQDPGWNVGDPATFTPLVSVDTTALPPDVWQVTTIRAAGSATLGQWRWLAWTVQPPHGFENTTYQEIEISTEPGARSAE